MKDVVLLFPIEEIRKRDPLPAGAARKAFEDLHKVANAVDREGAGVAAADLHELRQRRLEPAFVKSDPWLEAAMPPGFDHALGEVVVMVVASATATMPR